MVNTVLLILILYANAHMYIYMCVCVKEGDTEIDCVENEKKD